MFMERIALLSIVVFANGRGGSLFVAQLVHNQPYKFIKNT